MYKIVLVIISVKMSLVAYENSDPESENSENEDRENGKVIIPEKPSEKDLFTTLPQPNVQHNADEIKEDEDEFLKKKEIPVEKPQKKKVKISIPSLSEFADDEDDEPSKKKQKSSLKSSGLFALLPSPKTQPITTKHFIPNSVKRNGMSKPVVKKTLKSKAVKKPDEPQKSDPIVPEEMESDDEDLKDIPDSFDEEAWQKICGRPKRTPKPVIEETVSAGSEEIIEIAPEPVKPYQGLNNQAFKELLGASGKRKAQNISIVDINEDEILPDKDIWMSKALTDPEMAAKYIAKDPVNDTCKRKHHITYLAQQAKENEQELQNQWASNRFTRQKTQAKYGF